MADHAAAGSKRVSALTGYMLILLVAAASVGLYRLDAEDFRADAQALVILQAFDRYLAEYDPAQEATPLRRAAKRALDVDHPDLHAAMIAGQEVLFDHLRMGLEGFAPFPCEELRQRQVEDKGGAQRIVIEPSATEVEDVLPFSLISISSPWLERRTARDLDERGTVAQLLDSAAHTLEPFEVRVARTLELEPLGLDPCPEPDAEAAPRQQVQVADVYAFKGAELVDKQIHVRYAASAPQHVQRQPVEETVVVQIDADVVTISGRSAAQLMADFGGEEWSKIGADLVVLSNRPDALDRLTRDYGFLPIDYAVATAGAALVQGYAGSTLFGLRLTPRRLSVAVATLAVTLAGVLAAEALAALRGGRPLRDRAPEGVLALVSSHTAARFVIWSIAPAAAILLAASLEGPWVVAAALAGSLGAAATYLASRADRSAAVQMEASGVNDTA